MRLRGCKVSRLPGFEVGSFRGVEAIRLLGFKASRLQGSQVSRLPGCQASPQQSKIPPPATQITTCTPVMSVSKPATDGTAAVVASLLIVFSFFLFAQNNSPITDLRFVMASRRPAMASTTPSPSGAVAHPPG